MCADEGKTAIALRDYQCGQCGYQETIRQAMADPVLSVCPWCKSPSLQRVYSPDSLPTVHYAGGQPSRVESAGFVGGDRKFWRPFIGRERDGNETVYASEAQMVRAEYERAPAFLTKRGKAKHAQQQVVTARKYHGLRPGTQAAAQVQATAEHAPR